jgi:hypothetical protein
LQKFSRHLASPHSAADRIGPAVHFVRSRLTAEKDVIKLLGEWGSGDRSRVA